MWKYFFNSLFKSLLHNSQLHISLQDLSPQIYLLANEPHLPYYPRNAAEEMDFRAGFEVKALRGSFTVKLGSVVMALGCARWSELEACFLWIKMVIELESQRWWNWTGLLWWIHGGCREQLTPWVGGCDRCCELVVGVQIILTMKAVIWRWSGLVIMSGLQGRRSRSDGGGCRERRRFRLNFCRSSDDSCSS